MGRRIEEGRLKRGWTQARAADEVGAIQSTISRWESGDTLPGPEDFDDIKILVSDLTMKEFRERELKDRLSLWRSDHGVSHEELIEWAKDLLAEHQRSRFTVRRAAKVGAKRGGNS